MYIIYLQTLLIIKHCIYYTCCQNVFFNFDLISALWHNSKACESNHLKFGRNFGQISEDVGKISDNFDPIGNNFGQAYLFLAH